MTRTSWLRQLRNRLAGTPTRRPDRRRPRLAVETLEARDVPTAVAVPDGLVSWWTADNTAADATGLNNATLVNGATYAAAEVGQGFSFDGVDDRAVVADSSSLALTGSMSIEGWILVRGFPAGAPSDHGEILFRGDDRGGLDPYSLSVEPNGTLVFQVTNASNRSSAISAPIPTGQLLHVAATLDDASGAMTLYVNGTAVGQTMTTIRPFGDLDPASNPGIGIGNHGGYPNTPHNFPFNGLIDELSVYNRALTPSEVLGIAKAGSSGKVVSPIAVDGPSVVEGATGATAPATFTLRRTGSLSGSLTVNWATADDTATAGSDYIAASGSVTFADGEATQTVTLLVNGDSAVEPDETFQLVATPAGGTAVLGVATIRTDDVAVSVADDAVSEGDTSLRNLGHFVSPGSGGLPRARSSLFGPDGNLYVASVDTNSILRYDPTGTFIDAFVPTGSGGLNDPWGLTFGPDGNLYVSSIGNGEVLCYDGSTGDFLGITASGLSTPGGLTFGPDGSLYIANEGTNEVLRLSGGVLGSFVTAGSGGLSQPRNAAFGPDGSLYVASQGTRQVLRYDAATGAFKDVFATMPSSIAGTAASWLAFGTDGYLYVTGRASTSSLDMSILRFNATTGAFVDAFALGRDGWSFTVGPENIIYDSSNGANVGPGGFVDRIGPASIATFTVSLGSASAAPVTVSFSTADGSAIAGIDYIAMSGTITFAPGETTKTILVPTLNDAIAEATKSFTLTLSNATGALIVDGTGTGTIVDDDSTKFYVVNDGSPDRTYEYGPIGSSIENYGLNSGNTAPRGAVSTAAGDKVWVVDANKTVYVYNAAGTLLGSWSAGSMNGSAQVQGIASDGTDIWLVDAKQDKVFRYTNAASRLSGSQNAAGSFALNSGNKNPKDIVTDGTYLWVVDDSSTDKVFKYTLAGSLQGNWTITGGGGSPTGITLDPANPQHLWIVDNGTDRVYQYDNAVGRTSGSQAASTSFALAAGNTNPQGIADPPCVELIAPAATPIAAPSELLGRLDDTNSNVPIESPSGVPIAVQPKRASLVVEPIRIMGYGVNPSTVPTDSPSSDDAPDGIWLGNKNSLLADWLDTADSVA